MRHLFSPHYSIMQMLQPFMTTYPVLAGKYGDGAAWTQITAGLQDRWGQRRRWATASTRPGRRSATSTCTAGAASRRQGHRHARRDVAGHGRERGRRRELQHAVRRMRAGCGAASGIEAAATAEQDLTKAEIGAAAGDATLPRAMPEAAEGINRYVTALPPTVWHGSPATPSRRRSASACWRSSRRRAATPRPTTRRSANPLSRLPLQFKKYGADVRARCITATSSRW